MFLCERLLQQITACLHLRRKLSRSRIRGAGSGSRAAGSEDGSRGAGGGHADAAAESEARMEAEAKVAGTPMQQQDSVSVINIMCIFAWYGTV